jgi:hypothetical protein
MKRTLNGFGKESLDETSKQEDTAKEVVNKTEEEKDKTVVMSGPLSEVYTKALDIVFSKDSDVINKLEISKESQANDAIMNAAIAAAVNQKQQLEAEQLEESIKNFEPFKITNQANTFVYAADPANFSLEDISNMAGYYAVAGSVNPNAQLIIYVDGVTDMFGPTQTGVADYTSDDKDAFSPVATVGKAVVKQMGIQVATSLESLITLLKK